MTKKDYRLIAHAIKHVRDGRAGKFDAKTLAMIEEQLCRELHAAESNFDEVKFLTASNYWGGYEKQRVTQ